jgi:1-acyl-sn-glycerol-3-phosphate acyltransferase
MKKILFWPYQLYEWLILIPLLGIFTLIFGTLMAASASLINPHFASRVFAVTWARLIGWLTPIAVTVEGKQNANRKRSYVVVSNHQSQYDIIVIYGWLELDLKWVMKQELRKYPVIGFGCEKAGHIFIDRRNPRLANQAIAEALDRLGEGIGIFIFPEGTRSPDGKLIPFKKGAFRLAIEQNLPVLPVTMLGTRDILPANTLKIFPGRARMVIHPAIETDGLDLTHTRELMSAAKKAISSALPEELQ